MIDKLVNEVFNKNDEPIDYEINLNEEYFILLSDTAKYQNFHLWSINPFKKKIKNVEEEIRIPTIIRVAKKGIVLKNCETHFIKRIPFNEIIYYELREKSDKKNRLSLIIQTEDQIFELNSKAVASGNQNVIYSNIHKEKLRINLSELNLERQISEQLILKITNKLYEKVEFDEDW